MSLNNAPVSYEVVAENNEATYLIVTMDGINTLSIILECIGGAFDNESYSVHVSNNGEDWVKVYDLLLGYDVTTTNSFTYNSPLNSILFFRFVKFSVPSLVNGRTKIIEIGRAHV